MYKDKFEKARKLLEEATELLNRANEVEDAEEREELVAEAGKKQEQADAIKAEGIRLKEIQMSARELDEEISEVKEKSQERKKKEVKDGEFESWGEFLKSCFYADHRKPSLQRDDPRLNFFKEEPVGGHEEKQMEEGTGASGGYLVPTEFMAELQAVLGEDSLVRPNATVIQMSRRAIQMPVLDQSGSTADQPHWYGGMIAYWEKEAGQKDLTDASFSKVELVANKLIMYTRASDELMADSAISLADFLSGPMGFAGAIGWYEDYAFLRGTGVGQPLGVVNAGATINVTRDTANEVSYGDLVGMYESFLPSANGAWYFHQSCMDQLMTIQDPNNNYIWQPNAREGVPNVLFGMPVRFTEKLPRLGTAGDALLADWKYYLVGDRQATTVESTKFDRWRYDQTSWRAVHRVDGQPWLSDPITLADGTSTISPFVILS